MKPFHPSNVVPIPGVGLALVLTMVGGAVTGAAVYYISKVIYLVFLFPILMGFIVGWLASGGIKLGKIRSPIVGILLGILGGVVVYGGMWTAQYLYFRDSITQIVVEKYGPQDQALVEIYIDKLLVTETGQDGFIGYLAVTAREGVEISPVHSVSGKGFNLGETGSYIYWLIELVLIIAFGIRPPRKEASMPFCEQCDKWLGKEKFLGLVEGGRSWELLVHANSGNFAALPPMFQESMGFPMIGIYFRSCNNCQMTDSFLSIRMIAQGNNGKLVHKPLVEGMINHFQMNDLLRQPLPVGDSPEIQPV